MKITTGSESGRVLLLLEVPAMLGRGANCSLRVSGSGISRQHAAFGQLPDGRIEIADLASTNGTLVNGAPINRQTLGDGDRISLSPNLELQYRIISRASRQPPQASPSSPLPVSAFLSRAETLFTQNIRNRTPVSLLHLRLDTRIDNVVEKLLAALPDIIPGDYVWGKSTDHDHYVLIDACAEPMAQTYVQELNGRVLSHQDMRVTTGIAAKHCSDLCDLHDLLEEAEGGLHRPPDAELSNTTARAALSQTLHHS